VDWIELAQEWSKWRTHINKVMNFQVPKNAVNFWNSLGAASFSKRLCAMEFVNQFKFHNI
jgi:hypothetical protein